MIERLIERSYAWIVLELRSPMKLKMFCKHAAIKCKHTGIKVSKGDTSGTWLQAYTTVQERKSDKDEKADRPIMHRKEVDA